MMKKKKVSKKYEGMGFAEALIALMIAGVVGIVLMRISSSTLRELAQLDIQDSLAQYAVSASVDLQKIAIADMERDEKQFNETDIIEGSYYDINEEGTEIMRPPVTYSASGRDSFTLIPNTDYFRIFRVVSIDEGKAILEIITGVSSMAGLNTSSTDIKDYSYLVTIVR